jgi:diguanylate cyclase (GGDEF)-like protein
MQEAKIDPNTGFLDRYSCLNLATDMVDQAEKNGRTLTALWIDLDRFKQINESFGYNGGDSIILTIADRLRKTINGKAEIGRLAADEFVCLVYDVDLQSAEKLGIDLMRAIEPPLTMGDFKVRLTASIGIAVLEAEESASEFLERADWSKNTAKKQGVNRYVISGDELLPSHMGIMQAREELEVEYLLHNALETSGLQLHYQPILGFKGNVLSVEGLMRCTVNGKSIPPVRFFPVAEKSGLIVRLGDWSLIQGTSQARQLSKAGLGTKVSINISRGQLADARFSQALHAAIILADVEPDLIELELTESLLIDVSGVVQTNLLNARDIGVTLAIDNFGMGNSNLANLKNIPVTKLKLGRALTMALPEDRRSFAVVKAMVQMGKDLGMTMIAEGVETKEQMETLRELDVDGIQGYYYAKPMDVETLSVWLKDREHS